MTWMCELCFPEGKEIGMIAPGYSLIYACGKYHVLGGQGHRDHEILTFETMPWPDPDPECLNDLPPEQEELANRWLDEVDQLDRTWKIRPAEGHAFLATCLKEGGWQGDGIFTFWLYDKAGKLIQAAENGEPLHAESVLPVTKIKMAVENAHETSHRNAKRPQDEARKGNCTGVPRRHVVPDPPYSIWGQDGPDFIV